MFNRNIDTMKLLLVYSLFCGLMLGKPIEEWFEPEWNGEECAPGHEVDVGRGPGSCDSDCQCQPCAPFCNAQGFCSQEDSPGRKQCSLSSNKTAGVDIVSVPDIECRFNCECPRGHTMSIVTGKCVSTVPEYYDYDDDYDDYYSSS